MENTLLSCVGYFDEAGQTEPAHNPQKHGGNCPVCSESLKDQKLMYRSLMPMGGQRSYFIAYHDSCDKSRVDELEPDIMDEIFAWDDAV